MSDLIQGIPYLSLNDAAIELSKITKSHNIDSKMILNLALHKKIRIFWHLRGQYLQDIQKIDIDEAFETYGHYEINISEFPWKNDWLNELIYGTPAASQILHEVQVKNKNSIFRVVMPIKIRPPSEFCGGDFIPTENEIFISHVDLEKFEQTHQGQDTSNKKTNISNKGISNESYREALGLMALMISKEDKAYRNSKEKPNHATIAGAVQMKANEILGDQKEKYRGLSNLSKAISEGLEQLEKNL